MLNRNCMGYLLLHMAGAEKFGFRLDCIKLFDFGAALGSSRSVIALYRNRSAL